MLHFTNKKYQVFILWALQNEEGMEVEVKCYKNAHLITSITHELIKFEFWPHYMLEIWHNSR